MTNLRVQEQPSSEAHHHRFWSSGCPVRLFQRRIDIGELLAERSAERVDSNDDRDRNTRCNQAVFDRGGT
jgi:hypothetical protein